MGYYGHSIGIENIANLPSAVLQLTRFTMGKTHGYIPLGLKGTSAVRRCGVNEWPLRFSTFIVSISIAGRVVVILDTV